MQESSTPSPRELRAIAATALGFAAIVLLFLLAGSIGLCVEMLGFPLPDHKVVLLTIGDRILLGFLSVSVIVGGIAFLHAVGSSILGDC